MNSSSRRHCFMLYCFVAVVLAIASRPAAARIWTDDQGRKVEADLVRVEDGAVILRVVATGQEYAWPLAKLSDADQTVATSTYRLVMSLRSRDSDTREKAIEQLVDIGIDVVPALIEETKHKNGGKGSIETLVKIGEPAIPHLLRHGERVLSDQLRLGGKIRNTGYPIGLALLRMPVPALLAAVRREKDEVRVAFMYVLRHDNSSGADFVITQVPEAERQMMGERRFDLLAEMVNDPSDLVRKSAMWHLTFLAPQGTSAAAIRVFRPGLTSADPGTRVWAARALCIPTPDGRLFPRDDARELILSTMTDVLANARDPVARRDAAQLVTSFSVDKAMVPLLIKLVSDPDRDVSARAARQLAILGPDAVAAVPALIKLLQAPQGAPPENVTTSATAWTPQSRQRRAVAESLIAIGLSQPGVVNALVAASGDSDSLTCSAIVTAFSEADLLDPGMRDRISQTIKGNARMDDRSKWKLYERIGTRPVGAVDPLARLRGGGAK